MKQTEISEVLDDEVALDDIHTHVNNDVEAKMAKCLTLNGTIPMTLSSDDYSK